MSKPNAMDRFDRQQQVDANRQKAIDAAVLAAHRIIMDASDGSVQETYYLTARVAENLMQSALAPFQSAITQYDIEQRQNEEK
jgi:hypothetical protein